MQKASKLVSVILILGVIFSLVPEISVFANETSGYTVIGDYALNSTTLVKYLGNDESVIVPQNLGITEIGEFAFPYNGNIRALELPSGVVSIAYSAFSSLYNLQAVTLPGTLEEIGDYAFNNTDLQGVIIPPGVTDIGVGAFPSWIDDFVVWGYTGTEAESYADFEGVYFGNLNEIQSIEIDLSKTVTLSQSNITRASLNPETHFTDASSVPNIPPAAVWSSSNTAVAVSDIHGRIVPITAGNTTVTVTYGGKSAQSNVTVTGIVPQTIVLDTAYSLTYGDMPSLYEFTPVVSGQYRFYSFDNGETSAAAHLYDSTGNQISSNYGSYDDDGEWSSNFNLTYNLTAGQTYYYRASLNGGSGLQSDDAYKVRLIKDKEVSSISVLQPPDRTDYIVRIGDWIDYSGLKITVNYADSTSAIWEYDKTYGSFNGEEGKFIPCYGFEKTGDNAIIVEYGGKKTSFTVQGLLLKDAKAGASAITLNQKYTETGVTLKEWYQYTPTVTGRYNLLSDVVTGAYTYIHLYNGDGESLEGIYFYHDGNLGYQLEAGQTYFYCIDTDTGMWNPNTKTVEFELTQGKTVTGIAVTKLPDKNNYIIGVDDYINVYGMELTAYYSGGTQETFVCEDTYEFNCDGEGVDFNYKRKDLRTSTTVVTVTWSGKTDSFTLTGIENPLDYFTVTTSKPQIDEYTNGWLSHTWDDQIQQSVPYFYYEIYSSDLTVTLHYKDSTTKTCNAADLWDETGYSCDINTKQSYQNQWGAGTHTVTVSFFGKSATVNVEIIGILGKFADSTELTLDIPSTAAVTEPGGYDYFKFIPEESGNYMFYSISDDYNDTYGYLHDSDGKQLSEDDDSGGNGNFRINYYLEAGKTYYYRVRYYQSDKTGSFDVVLIRNPGDFIDRIELTSSKTEFTAGSDGSWDSNWNYNTQSYDLYYRYNISEYLTMTVYYKDGSDEDFRLADLSWSDYSFFDNQYSSPWNIGMHTVEITYFGKTAYCDVEVIESNVKSIEVSSSKTELLEYTDWYSAWLSRYLPDPYDLTVTVNYNDGSSRTFTGSDFRGSGTGEYGEYASYSIDYDGLDGYVYFFFENQEWELGAHTFDVRYGGQSTDLDVEVVEGNIERIEIILDEPIEIIQNTEGYYSTRWNTPQGNAEEYFHYYIGDDAVNLFYNYSVSLKVYYKDGTDAVYSGNEIYNTFGKWPSFSTSQYDSPWEPGTNTATISFMGKSAAFNVEIIESPVDYFTVTTSKPQIIENADGWWSNSWNNNIFFAYSFNPNDLTITVHYNDGRGTVSYSGSEIGELTGYHLEVRNADQWNEPWGIGNHIFTVDWYGKTAVFDVEIIENPVDYFTVTPVKPWIAEHTDGYWNWRWNEDTQQDEEFFYYYAYNDTLLITVYYKDGTSISYYSYELEEQTGYSLNHGNQYENPLCLGKNTLSVKWMGKSAVYYLEIIPADIILGDIMGNGIIDDQCLEALKRHILKIELLKGNAVYAADMNGDTKIDICDLLMLKEYIVENPITEEPDGYSLNMLSIAELPKKHYQWIY